MLEVQNLSKTYGKYLAVDHVTFMVRAVKLGFYSAPMAQESQRS